MLASLDTRSRPEKPSDFGLSAISASQIFTYAWAVSTTTHRHTTSAGNPMPNVFSIRIGGTAASISGRARAKRPRVRSATGR